MRVLITSAGSRLGRELAASLNVSHQVRQTDTADVADRGPGAHFVRSDLGHDGSTNDLVKGIDAIIHPGGVDPEATVSDQLDYAMRCTYNLLWAAAEERVPRFIYLSSLSILHGYDEDYVVTERWRPVPTTDPPVLCYHLGEYVCREFARERKLDVVCLRLGEMVWEEGASAVSSSAVFPDDAVQAIEGALDSEVSGWDIFHVQSDVPNARFTTAEAQQSLGFKPRQIGDRG